MPRQKDLPNPTPEMINEARQGNLIGFFEDGRLYRAADFIGEVSPQTAKMSLDDTWEYQTRPLSAFLSPPAGTKSLRNLFFLAVQKDELPSYHFWTGPQDPDLVIKEKPTDWNEVLQNSKPAGWEEMPEQSNDEPDSARQPSDEQKDRLQQTKSSTSQKQMTTSGKEPTTATGSSNRNTWPSPFKLPGLDSATPEDRQVSPKGTVHSHGSNQESGIRRASILSPHIFMSTQSPTSRDIPPQGNSPFRKSSLLALTAKPSQDAPKESSVLLRCDRGGMELRDFSKPTFKSTMLHIIDHEENNTVVGSGLRFLDILKPGKETSEQASLKSKPLEFDRVFAREIQPFLGVKGCHFRVRSDAYPAQAPWDNGNERSLKITRVDVGYCYVNPEGSWSDPRQLQTNSDRFESALEFLFDKKKDNGEDADWVDRLTLEIPPDYEPFDIRRSSETLVPIELGEILEEISQSSVSSGPYEPIQYTFAAEVFVHKTGENFVHPLTRAMQARKKEEERAQADEEGLRKQQEAQEAGDTENTPQQPEQGQWSRAGPWTNFEYSPGPIAPSTRPKVRTQSEIGDLERRLKIADERVIELSRTNPDRDHLQSQIDGQVQQIGYLARENGELEESARTAEKKVTELEQQRSQLRTNQRDLEREVRELKRESDELRNHVDGLNVELFQHREDRILLRSTIENLESQAVVLKEERDQLQSRVDAAESATTGQDQRNEGSGNNAAGDSPDRNEKTSDGPAAGPSAPDDRPTDVPPPQDTTAPAVDPPSGSADPKKLLYCTVCIKSVDKLDDNSKTKHAEKCSTTVPSFQLLTVQEAKEMRKEARAPSAKVKGKGRATSADDVDGRESEAGPSGQAGDPAEETSTGPKAAKADTDRKRKRSAKDDGKPDEPSEPSTRPKRNAKKPVKDPQEGAPPVAKKAKTKATRTRQHSPETVDPDGDSSAGELGPIRKRKSKDADDLPPTKATTSRTRGQASAPPAEMTERDGDSSPAETGPKRKRKAKDDVEEPTRVSQRKKSKK